MGARFDDPFGGNAQPIHRTIISYAFFMGKHEVTQSQWQAIMGSNPSEFQNCGGNCPVERVSWNEVQIFLKRLNARGEGFNYRLPSESEWEYAARAGTTTRFYWSGGQTPCQFGNVPDETARAKFPDWSTFNCRDGYIETSPVGRFQTNNFGLFDLVGNVDEWCQDVSNFGYNGAPTDGSPRSSGDFRHRVIRGGSWYAYTFAQASDYRSSAAPETRSKTTGFRVVATARN